MSKSLKGSTVKVKLLVALGALVAAQLSWAAEDSKAGVYIQPGQLEACAKDLNPCTLWSAEELANYHNTAYQKGWKHGQGALLIDLKRSGLLRDEPAAIPPEEKKSTLK